MELQNLKVVKIVLSAIVAISVIAVIAISVTTHNSPNNEKLDYDLNNTIGNQTTEAITYDQTETTTEEDKLSDDCTYILATGYDNGNYYELVANQTDNYSGVQIEMGVIKNNKWILELTSDMPFIGSDGALKNGKGLDMTGDNFYYIGNGVFLFSYDYRYSSLTIYETLDIVYNSITKESYECKDEHISLVKFRDRNTGELKFTYPNCDYIILNCKRYSGFYSLTLLNFITMETKTLELSNQGFPADTDSIYPIADGIIAMVGGQHIRFYDTNGKITYDGDFNYTSLAFAGDAFVMKDGKCRFSVKNNNGTVYDIAINKYGEVIE